MMSCPEIKIQYVQEGGEFDKNMNLTKPQSLIKLDDVIVLPASEVESNNEHEVYYISEGDIVMNNQDSNSQFLSVLFQTEKTEASVRSKTCTVCSKIFSSPSALRNHLRIHNGEQPYTCEVCNKKFTQQSNLWKHVHIHTGEKRYQCRYCEKKFSQRANLNKHELIHQGKKPHTCEYCSKSFTQRAHLTKHICVHTGEKPYMCEICLKQFGQISNLQKHNLIHIGRKPFKCNVCDRAFVQNSNLKKHMEIHSVNRTLHKCSGCSKQFSKMSLMLNHTRQCIKNK